MFARETRRGNRQLMDGLTLFGLFAVTSMLVTYALEKRSRWFVLPFAISWDQPMDSFKAHGPSGW
jgi:hypothetical protein